MTKRNLLEKELSNLYAINKQINNYFNGSEINFLKEEHQLLLMDYLKLICQSENNTANILDELDFNPTNTTDSIIGEITENLNNIVKDNLEDDVKSFGYLMSVNRLISYQLANFENIKFINSGEVNSDMISELMNNFASIKAKLFSPDSVVKN